MPSALTMHSRPSFSLIGIAVLSNIASGFSCNAQVPPLPTSAFIRNAVPTSASCSMNSLNKNIFQQRDEDIVSSLHARGGDSTELGASAASSDAAVGKDLNLTTGKVLASLWGSCGMVYILVKAIKRVLPIALEPFTKAEGVVPLTQFQLA